MTTVSIVMSENGIPVRIYSGDVLDKELTAIRGGMDDLLFILRTELNKIPPYLPYRYNHEAKKGMCAFCGWDTRTEHEWAPAKDYINHLRSKHPVEWAALPR